MSSRDAILINGTKKEFVECLLIHSIKYTRAFIRFMNSVSGHAKRAYLLISYDVGKVIYFGKQLRKYMKKISDNHKEKMAPFRKQYK